LQTDVNKIIDVLKFPVLDSASGGNWRAINISNNTSVLRTQFNTQQINKIPNVVGLGLKDAVYLLENLGLKVSASGRGKVIYQSLAGDANINKGEAIKIQLN
jgi:cell division protein FtsI (penicillin-binding protein 3)